MVTYIKIGTCDELKEWGRYDPIPATTECCCCGTTVIDIITPNKDKPIVVPDKPKEDTPTNPSENNGSTDNGNTGNTDTGTSTQPSENGGSTDSGSVTPSQPSDNTGTTTPTDNTGNTDNGNSGNTGTTEPTTPSENGNTGTDTGTTQPSENSGTTTQPDAPTVYNTIYLNDVADDTAGAIIELGVRGKVGEQVRLGDILSKLSEENRNYYDITEDGNLKKDGTLITLNSGESSVSDYVYTFKENWHEETVDVKSKRLTSSENVGDSGNTNTGGTSTDNGSTDNPQDNSGNNKPSDSSDKEEKKASNIIYLEDETEPWNPETLVTLRVSGSNGEKIRLGDFLSKLSKEDRNGYDITNDGNLMKDGVLVTLVNNNSSISDYVYTIVYSGDDELHEETIDVEQRRL